MIEQIFYTSFWDVLELLWESKPDVPLKTDLARVVHATVKQRIS